MSGAGGTDKSSKFKSFMGTAVNWQPQSVFKSFTLSVLDKIDAALSLTSSSETETTANRNEEKLRIKLKEQHERNKFCEEYSLADHIIDFEARKVKERRAHEEILSGRYRHPAFVSRSETNTLKAHNNHSFKNSFSADFSCPITLVSPPPPNSSTRKSPSVDIVVVEKYSNFSASTPLYTINACRSNKVTTKDNNLLGIKSSASTCETSENDNISGGDLSLESFDVKMWTGSESDHSAPSYASSISLDSQSEEAILEFMRRFVNVIFKDCSSITLELKAEFGVHSRTETGRMWFARFVNAQRSKTKRVDETTFYALIQNFAIVLFECSDSDDFGPAKTLMSMCFTFYHEVQVPGCEPYREYLYTYLREQPIFHTLRFWSAAFFDALQNERSNKPVPPTRTPSVVLNLEDDGMSSSGATKSANLEKNPSLPISENDFSLSSSSSSNSDAGISSLGISFKNEQKTKGASRPSNENIDEIMEDKKFQQNITFGQLGSFTCNMHAFGLGRDLCNEFLKKQCTIANLSKEQEKMLQDNVNRMYRETDPWRS